MLNLKSKYRVVKRAVGYTIRDRVSSLDLIIRTKRKRILKVMKKMQKGRKVSPKDRKYSMKSTKKLLSLGYGLQT